MRCREKNPVTIAEVARELNISRTTVSRHIQTLLDVGWLEERMDPNDDRRKRYVVTPERRRLADETLDALIDVTMVEIQEQLTAWQNTPSLPDSLRIRFAKHILRALPALIRGNPKKPAADPI